MRIVIYIATYSYFLERMQLNSIVAHCEYLPWCMSTKSCCKLYLAICIYLAKYRIATFMHINYCGCVFIIATYVIVICTAIYVCRSTAGPLVIVWSGMLDQCSWIHADRRLKQVKPTPDCYSPHIIEWIVIYVATIAFHV